MSMRLPRYVLGGLLLILCSAAALIAYLTQEPTLPPAPPVAAPAPPEPQAASADPVLELFNPTESEWQGQRDETAFKSQLENIVTTAFILRRCNYLTSETYNETYQAMAIYIQRSSPAKDGTSADMRIRAAVEAATPGYQLLYARLTCDSPQLATTATQLAQWRMALLSSPPR